MIRHIVMFKFKDIENKNVRREKIMKIKSALDDLINKIDVIKSFESGLNVIDSPRAYDLVLSSEFKNLDDLETYRKHPEHVKVVELMAEIKENAVAVDYEF